MADDKNGDPVDEVIGDDDDTSKQKPEEPKGKEPYTVERLSEIAEGLQKGFYATRSEMAELKSSLQTIADSLNTKSGAQEGDDQYVTVGSLRKEIPAIMEQLEASKVQGQAQAEKEASDMYEQQLDELAESGIINDTASERQALCKYAVDEGELNLYKAAAKFSKLSQEKQNKYIAQKQARQEEGSKVGTSSKTGAPSNKILYEQIVAHRGEW